MVKFVHNAGKETVMIYVAIRETLQLYFADLARKCVGASNTKLFFGQKSGVFGQ